MSAIATLKAILGIDSTQYEQGMGKAAQKSGDFAKQFERSLGAMKHSIKDTQESVVGVGEAMDGSFRGAAQAFNGIAQLFATNPVLAGVAAITAAVTGMAKAWENAENKIGSAIEGYTAKWKSSQDAWARLRGLRPTEDESARSAISGMDADQMDALLRDESRKTEQLKAKRDLLDEGVKKQTAQGDKDVAMAYARQAKDAAEILERQAKREQAIEKAISEFKKKEYDDRIKSYDTARAKELEIDERIARDAKEARKAQEKQDRESEGIAAKKLDLAASANQQAQDIMTRQRASRFDRADDYARIGGEVGGGMSPQLRIIDAQLKVQQELRALGQKTLTSSQSIDRNTKRMTGDE